ncbi:MAG TPA: response regulator transcription factor [Microthrixaceae bacterium]|nr:response regulator transcription factor [Microthrixaceae bacterium]
MSDFLATPQSGPAKILVVDDDRAIRESLERLFSLEGYSASGVSNGGDALEALRRDPVDLLVLDWMMPSVDGLTVCRVLRTEGSTTPILMLTARTETSERVAGLDAGADDYLAKPFDPAELLARVRALLRRSRPIVNDHPASLIVDDLRLDRDGRRCWLAGTEIQLSRIEFDLLEMLMVNVDIVLPRSRIYQQIWEYDFGPESKNLAVYISYLRRKIDEGREERLIHTVRSVGYVMRTP